MRVSTDAVSREVSMSKESALAVEGRAVTMKALCEGEHDVCELVDLVSDVAVGDLSEGQRDHALPHLESFSDGFICGSLADLRGVVLYAVITNRETEIQVDAVTQNNTVKRGERPSEKVKIYLGCITHVTNKS